MAVGEEHGSSLGGPSERTNEVAELLRNIARHAPVGMALKDASGRVLWSNPALQQMLGFDDEELRGMFRTEFTFLEDRAEDARLYEELLRGERDSFGLEKRYLTKDGGTIWGRLSIFRVEGEADLFLVVVEDIERSKEAEARLREAEARHRNVVESMGEGLLITDLDDVVLYVNLRMTELSGYTAEDMLGHRAYELLLPPGRREETRLRNEERARGRAERYETRLRRKDDTSVVVEVSAAPYRDASGEIVGTVGTYYDITERVRAERALEESERRFRGSFHSAAIGMALVATDGRFLQVNPALCRIVGYPEEELLHKTFRDITHPDDLDVDLEQVRRMLSGEIESYHLEKRYLHRRGRVVWALLSVSLVRGEEGESLHFVSQVQDITERKRAEQRLGETEERYRNLVEQIPAVTYIDPVDDPETSLYTSPYIQQMLGYTPEEWIEGRLWPKRVHPDDRERVLAADERFEKDGKERFGEEYRLLAKDGSVIWVREGAVLISDEDGKPLFWQGVMMDVTEQKESEQRLKGAEERYRALVENIPAVAYTQEVGDYTSVLYLSPRIEDWTGYSPEDFQRDPDLWYGVVHPEDREMVEAEDGRTEETGEPFRLEYRMLHRDGRVMWVRDESVLVRGEDGTPLYWQGVMSDVTERRALEEQLIHQALHDPLTGLPNRVLLQDRLRRSLEGAKRNGDPVAVLFVDLDNFKVVNDSLGHGAGDRLLAAVGERLRAAVRRQDTVARLGGDEFIFLLEDGSLRAARSTAERILAQLKTPIAIDGREVFITPSIGVALEESGARPAQDLLRNADLAMYRAKHAGKARYAIFEEGMDARALERLEKEHGIRRALERGEFVVHYQPKVSLDSGRVVGFEALVRWEHPERGLVLPGEFVPVAEETGLILPIDEAVLREACARAKAWQDEHPQASPIAVCVNLSARRFREPGLPETVSRILEQTGLDPDYLLLEVTESLAMADAPATAAVLQDLLSLGVRGVIDDFGTGYSSLSYLERFPVSQVKIDRSFVGRLGEDPGAVALTKGVIDLAHALDLEVIAEGVETKEQSERLRGLGCDLAQGYYFSKPLPEQAARALLAEHRRF